MQKLTVNGIQMAFERWGGLGDGTPLVLLHGFPLSHVLWKMMIEHLEGVDVVTPDLRGFGESAVVDGAYSISDMADDVMALLDALKMERAALVGHSMGGYVALAAARKYPSRIAGLGLVATQALADNAERKAGRYTTAEQVGAQGSVFIANAMAPNLSADPMQGTVLWEMILRQPAAGIMGALAAMAERPDSTDVLPTIKVPVAIVHGLADALIPPERSHEMKKAIPQASLTELPNVGHCPMLEAPVETAQALKGILG